MSVSCRLHFIDETTPKQARELSRETDWRDGEMAAYVPPPSLQSMRVGALFPFVRRNHRVDQGGILRFIAFVSGPSKKMGPSRRV